MHLPGRLGASSLQQILAHLERDRVSGALDMVVGSVTHRIELCEGYVVDVVVHRPDSIPQASATGKYGASIVEAFRYLETLQEAKLRFRAMVPRARVSYVGSDVVETVPPGDLRERHLERLGLDGWADQETIKRRYRTLVRAYHPDRHPEAGETEKRALCIKVAEVLEAYRHLSEPGLNQRAHHVGRDDAREGDMAA